MPLESAAASATGERHPPQRNGGDSLTNRIPSLDGLRAIAIMCVIAAHAAQRGAPWIPTRAMTYLNLLSLTGVKVFFVLSGFLITSLLLKELRNTGTVSLRGFYWRRTLRIFPAMYAFLLLIGVAYAVGIIRIGKDSPFRIFAALAYVSDYVSAAGWPQPAWPLHHTWSLSVEEQFYLLWPAALVVSGLRRAWVFPAVLILVALISRAIAFDEFRLDSVADSLAVGCLASIYRRPIERAIQRLWPRSLPVSSLLLLALALLPAANTYSRHALFSSLVGIPMLIAAIGIAMLAVMMQPPKWLNAGPVTGLGRLSYSLYLWQQPWVMDLRTGWLWLPGALCCAWLSYRFIEKPVLEWRDRKRVTVAVGSGLGLTCPPERANC